MTPFELVDLVPMMNRTQGSSGVKIGLIDGPVLVRHADISIDRIVQIPEANGSSCRRADSMACMHGTFVAGILSAKRISPAPAICPGCTLVVRPVFAESPSLSNAMPTSSPSELAAAVFECIQAGVKVINLSLALANPSTKSEGALEDALDYAAKRKVIVVAAAGNQGSLGSSAITRHPWVLPVVACDLRGRPASMTNLGSSIGRNGLRAPGHNITSLGARGRSLTLSGTSVAAPFVTGAIALLMSAFPNRSAAEIKLAVTKPFLTRRPDLIPPMLNAEASYRALANMDR